MKKTVLFSFLFLILIFSSCKSTKVLKENEYMLTKNSVNVVDVSGTRFDDLVYLVRPETNKKFMGIFNIKTACYAAGQPKRNEKTGEEKDTKFRSWLREKRGEKPVSLDSAQIQYSMEQIGISMRKSGYFDAKTSAEVLFHGRDKKKARVNYSVTAYTPSFIREIRYDIEIPEFRKIILLDSANCLFKTGDQYDETVLANERNRITNLIRNRGYFHFSREFISIEVDTMKMHQYPDAKGRPTLALTIKGNTNRYRHEDAKKNLDCRYIYNNVYIYTNYDLEMEGNAAVDTVRFRSYRNKRDSTSYYFITPKVDKNRFDRKHQLVKDFKYRTLTDMIYTKKGWTFSSDGYNRSYKRLSDLNNNFSIINIEYIENRGLRDTLLKKGELDVRYKLTRTKLHSLAGELSARSDRANLSFTYSNKNIFRGAEKLSVNMYGGVVYQNAINKGKKEKAKERENPNKNDVRDVFGNIGGTVTLDFPRLFIFKQTQKIEALKYSTSVSFGANYSWQYNRFMMNTGITYNWSPNYQMNHSFTPLMISTIDISTKTRNSIQNYPESFKGRFTKDIIFGFKYGLHYLVPTDKNRHILQLKLDLESSGLMPYSANKINNAIKGIDKTWLIMNYNYTTYEKGEFTLRYTYTLNKNSAIATRFNMGVAASFDKEKHIPFEGSFYLGGANSMRGWGVRTLGPGAYSPYNQGKKIDFERVGDIKLEMNLEYRGTIFKAFKYGIFADMGNIWLLRQYDDMPNATFQWNEFYKQIALAVGAGLRLDFKFFLIRIDYGVPIYNPSMPKAKGYWINEGWGNNKDGQKLSWVSGFQFAIGHAF